MTGVPPLVRVAHMSKTFSTIIGAILAVLLSVSTPGYAETKDDSDKYQMTHLKTIVLDPGHGGENQGCIGPAKIHEKVVTLQLGLKLEEALKEKVVADVVLTRRKDVYVGLRERTRMANEKNGDVFISIHMNASPTGSGIGIETFLLSSSSSSDEIRALVEREQKDLPIEAPMADVRREELGSVLYDMKLRAAHSLSEKLASKIQRSMIRKTGAVDRGVKQAPFAVLKEAEMPAIVLECGFLTHPKEGDKLLDPAYQKKLAAAIVRGLIDFDKSLKSDSP